MGVVPGSAGGSGFFEGFLRETGVRAHARFSGVQLDAHLERQNTANDGRTKNVGEGRGSSEVEPASEAGSGKEQGRCGQKTTKEEQGRGAC